MSVKATTINQSTVPVSAVWPVSAIAPYAVVAIVVTLLLVVYSHFAKADITSDLEENIFITVVLLAVFLVVMWALLGIWRALFRFSIAPDGIYVRYGLVSRPEYRIAYSQIKNVRPVTRGFDNLFGLASLIIEFTGQPEMQTSSWLGRILNTEVDRSFVTHSLTLDAILRRQLGIDRLYALNSGQITIAGLSWSKIEFLREAIKQHKTAATSEDVEKIKKSTQREWLAYVVALGILTAIYYGMRYALTLL